MSDGAGLRVYFVTHHDGHLTGILMRARHSLFAPPEPSAYGPDEASVLTQLELQLTEAELRGTDHHRDYLWTQDFSMGACRVEVHPESAVQARRVIGARVVPLRLSYAWARAEGGGYRVVLPRFGWWFVLESLDIAAEVIQSTIASALVGEKARWLYDFRREGDEYVRPWTPKWTARPDATEERDPFEGVDVLREVADELLSKTRRRRIPRPVGRHEDFLPLRGHLLTDRPSSLLVVGGPGVGKTTWLHRLAAYLLFEQKKGAVVPRIFATSRDRIVAGQVYLGMWQARCLEIVQALTGERDYLGLGRLAELLRPMSDGSHLAELFAEAIREGQISVILEATEPELEAARQAAPLLVDALHVVRLPEPDPRDVPPLVARYLEKRGAPERIAPEGLARLVRHLDDFVPGQCFPGKAYRAAQWILTEAGAEGGPLGPAQVSAYFSKWTGLPVELVADEYALGPARIAERLEARVIGQPEACRVAARVIARMKAGLQDPERPVGALFFVGPTGVGKTELAKQMARFLFGAGVDPVEDRMIRLDMSEYMLPGSAQRLLEAEASGSGSLAQRVRQQPLSLVLLDEIEKAHAEVFDLLLGVLGEGRMTDSAGRRVDFRMVVFVMTSNLGVREKSAVGFGDADGAAADRGFVARVRDHFRPEFFGRLDHVVPFSALTPEAIERVVTLLVDELAQRAGFGRRNLRLEVSAAARRRLAELGYHPTRGARPLKRTIEERVVTPLAVQLAAQPELRDQVVRVVAADEAPADGLVVRV